MDKVYKHKEHEKTIYSLWEKSGAFTPKKIKGKKAFCMIMPPSNANGDLHIGHARVMTIEDIITRYRRMREDVTLWLPGTDHAGIETQYVFEKELAKKGKSRFDYSRETLYKMIWDFTLKYKGKTESQLKSLGASCDWTRNTFTLDPKIIKVVYNTFKNLYDDGLIYRGQKIVNYCTRCGTNYSQLEMDVVEKDDNLYYLDYGSVTIATTRPETIFADVAVAVNPKDKRYSKLIGKYATLPIANRKLPIIKDSSVDISFGTGALKITPAHDALDFEIGQKNKLPIVSVIDESGKMVNTPKKYLGLSVTRAREAVIEDLKQLGVLKKTEKIHHNIAVCYKDGSLIEPKISEQWFLKVEPLAKKAVAAIKSKKVQFTAKRFEKIAIHWLNILYDWNISRQIAWGIRIPAFKCQNCLKWTITEGELPIKCKSCGHKSFKQDEDTFDTWFSSGQWPYASLKANAAGDFEYFYPTSLMETGYDILPFWVLRMIMLGLYKTGEVPFKEVLLHGLVRDLEGKKISKSKGNAINPLDMIEKYGCDALRMGIIWGSLVENDIALSEENIKGQRNFSNKIWNIARFVLDNNSSSKTVRRPQSKNADDKWILSELGQTVKKVTSLLDKYKINQAAEEIYDFTWHKFADKYIESIKPRKENAQPTLNFVLATTLALLHPFMPFVTEVIWLKGFAKNDKDLLISTPWPKLN